MLGSLKRLVWRALADNSGNKQDSEADFWRREIDEYIKWYNGEKELYETAVPRAEEKVRASNLRDSAILTWHKLHQEKKYLNDLKAPKNYFDGKKLLDIGAGPIPSATCFVGADLYSLDPLIDRYASLGFPLHYYGNTKFVRAFSEHIPMPDHVFDAIISANALDHVDDFEKTAIEIQRVLKPSGTVLFHLHYHLATQNEPLELNDERVQRAFNSIKDFHKESESKEKMGYRCKEGESFTLWSNRK